MTNIKSFNFNDLQIKTIYSLELFFRLQQIRVENNFVQEKLVQISEQNVEFREFVKESITHSLKLCCNAEDLIIFVKSCDDDKINNTELLNYLKTLLNDTKLLQEESIKLKDQITSIKVYLDKIVDEIDDYDLEITKKREELPKQINKEGKTIDGAMSYAKRGVMACGIGAAAVLAIPITGGASFVHFLGHLAVFGGAATTTVSTVVAGTSSIRSVALLYELESVREQISQILQEMQGGLKNIQTGIIALCESHWESQIIKIQYIIEKLERDNKNKLLGESILVKAKNICEDSKNYSVNMQEALNRYSVKSSLN